MYNNVRTSLLVS